MYKDLVFPTSSSTLLGYTQVRLREKVTRNRIRMAMPTPPAPMSCSYVATSPGIAVCIDSPLQQTRCLPWIRTLRLPHATPPSSSRSALCSLPAPRSGRTDPCPLCSSRRPRRPDSNPPCTRANPPSPRSPPSFPLLTQLHVPDAERMSQAAAPSTPARSTLLHLCLHRTARGSFYRYRAVHHTFYILGMSDVLCI